MIVNFYRDCSFYHNLLNGNAFQWFQVCHFYLIVTWALLMFSGVEKGCIRNKWVNEKKPDHVTILQKMALWFFLPWQYGLSSSTSHLRCFPSRNIMKIAETHPPPMSDVIIEQPPCYSIVLHSKDLVFYERIHCQLTWEQSCQSHLGTILLVLLRNNRVSLFWEKSWRNIKEDFLIIMLKLTFYTSIKSKTKKPLRML